MQNIQNFIAGQWISGDGPGQPLMHAITGEQFATVSSKGLDFQGIFDFARDKGNKSLRKMTFQESFNAKGTCFVPHGSKKKNITR